MDCRAKGAHLQTRFTEEIKVTEDVHLNDESRQERESEETALAKEDGAREIQPVEKEAEEKTPEPVEDELVVLRQHLEKEQAKAAEYLDGWQRARAELANARKRWERESAQTYTNALADSISRLLPVLDDFERAIQTLPDDLNGLNWVDGVLMIHRKLQTAVEQQGITPIEIKPGMPFDPAYHEAMTHEPHDTFEAGTVIDLLQKGYKLNDRIVRPALVRVSAGPLPTDAQDSQAAK